MHIPVRISKDPIQNDPTLSAYETPTFIKKKEKIVDNNVGAPNFLQTKAKKAIPNQDNVVVEKNLSPEEDIKNFISQFDNAKDRADKIKTLQEGKQRLLNEVDELRMKIKADITELLKSK